MTDAIFVIDMTAFTINHDVHRRARTLLDPFFSIAGVTRVEERVIVRVKKLCDRIDAFRGSGNVINLTYALGSLTTGKSRRWCSLKQSCAL